VGEERIFLEVVGKRGDLQLEIKVKSEGWETPVVGPGYFGVAFEKVCVLSASIGVIIII